jgi:beta-lactamase regulating signal transducer with metallopeptidase domain
MQSDGMTALGWTFVHSLWQIALIGFLLFILLRLIPGRSAHIRYTISTFSLWLIVALASITFIVMLPDDKAITEITGNLIFISQAKSLSFTERMSAWLEMNMPMMLSVWLGGVTILLLRLVLSMGWISHIRTNAIPQSELQSTLDQIIQRLQLKVKPGVATSGQVPSPLTIGYLKPIILFPVGIINQLSPYEVEAILTHELAHIVRKDYLSNLIQSFIETLFYYHPITWWISRMVRTERENRADDLAISWCGDQLGYAKALMTIQEMQVQSTPSLAIGFASQKGAMLARIQRILNLPYQNHNQMEKTVLLSLCSLCFLAFTLSSHTAPEVQANKSGQTSNINATVTVTADSIPTKGIYRIHKKTDDQEISVEVEDGDIKELKIDGKNIEPSEFVVYDDVIDELFNSVEAPPSMEGFTYTMPPMPPMPEGFEYTMPPMPSMPYMMEGFEYTIPEMPDMPPMPEMPDMRFLEMEALKQLNEDGYTITLFNPEILKDGVNISCDTTIVNGNQTIIIKMREGDSSVVCVPGHPFWSGDGHPSIAIDGRMMNEAEMQVWAEELERNAQSWGKDWEAQAEQWREQEKEWREQSRAHANQSREYANQWRFQQDMVREQMRHPNPPNEAQLRALERELGHLEQIQPFIYEFNSPRLSLTDEMIQDGLVEPGNEVEVQLTPDKLKINGEKMPENIHQKYLKMYEQQQGIELSGNSKVEFTTKSKQRM